MERDLGICYLSAMDVNTAGGIQTQRCILELLCLQANSHFPLGALVHYYRKRERERYSLCVCVLT